MTISTLRAILVMTAKETLDDDLPSLAGAVAYFTIFALPPLLVLVLGIAGSVFGPDVVQEALMGEIGRVVGPEAREGVQTMIANAGAGGADLGGKIGGLVALVVGATGAFSQLQKSLNRAWEVTPAPGLAGIRSFLLKRVLSFGLVLTIAFLLLVSLLVSAALAAIGDAASSVATDTFASPVMGVLNATVSFTMVALLFAALFKVLPDARVGWRDVAAGAVGTAALFTLGKSLIGLYLGRADPAGAFGAAGSVVLVLVWIYYSALIVLVGAEFTQAWVRAHGRRIVPENGAMRAEDDDPPSALTPPPVTTQDAPPPADVPADAGGFSIEDASSGIVRR